MLTGSDENFTGHGFNSHRLHQIEIPYGMVVRCRPVDPVVLKEKMDLLVGKVIARWSYKDGIMTIWYQS